MSDEEPQISILDARLAEIDRRLRTIQTGLAEDGEAPANGAGSAGGAEPADELGDGLSPQIAVPESAPPRAPAPRRVALAPPPPPDQSVDEDPGLVVAELRGLIADHGRLLDAMGELLASGERILGRAAETTIQRIADPAPGPPTAALPAAAAPVTGPPTPVSVTAGPFPSIDAVRDFERALRTLPGVGAVQVRGYEGGDRAVVDVHLSGPTP